MQVIRVGIADDHKIFFDIEIANRVSKMFKFDLDLIEYFDEDGTFHLQVS